MSFRLSCPNCGKRNVSEFSFQGEFHSRPTGENFSEWVDYVYFRTNPIGSQLEWWFHRDGCQRWFLAERDTTNNLNHRSFWYRDLDSTSSVPRPPLPGRENSRPKETKEMDV